MLIELLFNIASHLHSSEQKHTDFSNASSRITDLFKQILSPQLLQIFLKSGNAPFVFIICLKQYYQNNSLLLDEIKFRYCTFLKYPYFIKVLKKKSITSEDYFKYVIIYLSPLKIILSPKNSKINN